MGCVPVTIRAGKVQGLGKEKLNAKFQVDTTVPDEEQVLSGMFNTIVATTNTLSGARVVLRFTFDHDEFARENGATREFINRLVSERRSPFFLRTLQLFSRTFAYPDIIPQELDKSWESLRKTLKAKRTSTSGIGVLYGAVMERGDLGDMFSRIWNIRPAPFMPKETLLVNQFRHIVAFQALQGLAALHQAGMIGHYDVKTENIVFASRNLDSSVFSIPKSGHVSLLGATGIPGYRETSVLPNKGLLPNAADNTKAIVTTNIIDFGFAIFRQDKGGLDFKMDSLRDFTRGTPETMAPELVIAASSPDARPKIYTDKPDSYSLAAVFVQLFTRGTDISTAAGLRDKSAKDLPTIFELVSSAPDKIGVNMRVLLVLKMLFSGIPKTSVLNRYKKILENGGSQFGLEATDMMIGLLNEAKDWKKDLQKFSNAIIDTYKEIYTKNVDAGQFEKIFNIQHDSKDEKIILTDGGKELKNIGKRGIAFKELSRVPGLHPALLKWIHEALSWDFKKRPSVEDGLMLVTEEFLNSSDGLDILQSVQRSKDAVWEYKQNEIDLASLQPVGTPFISASMNDSPMQSRLLRCSNMWCRARGDDAVTLQFSHSGVQHTFCSAECARRFWVFIHPLPGQPDYQRSAAAAAAAAADY